MHVVQLSYSTIHPLSGLRKEGEVVDKNCCEGARNGRIRYYSDLPECTSLVYHSPPSTLFQMQRLKMSKSIVEIVRTKKVCFRAALCSNRRYEDRSHGSGHGNDDRRRDRDNRSQADYHRRRDNRHSFHLPQGSRREERGGLTLQQRRWLEKMPRHWH